MGDGGVDRAPYPVAVRLYGVAAAYWPEIDGYAALRGSGSLLNLSPDRFCNAVYAWCVERVEDREQFDAQLTAPYAGRSAVTADDELAGFAAFTAALGA